MNRNVVWQSWLFRPLVMIAVGWLAAGPLLAQRESAQERVSLTFFDANPKFLNGLTLPLKTAKTSEVADALAKAEPTRVGVAADGVSLLLIRVVSDRPGLASLKLTGGAPRGRLGTLRDLHGKTSSIETQPASNGQHVAYAVYTPPREFGQEYAGADAFSRELAVRIRFAPRGNSAKPAAIVTRAAPLRLVRPPVVLVHGMFHNPTKAWNTPPPENIGHATMVQRLTDRGFRVFLTDYHRANGSGLSGPSHLRDNQKVVWSAPGGIRAALEAYRKDGYAVTQADVVGHSMGGLLARAYARGKWLPPCKHCQLVEDPVKNSVNDPVQEGDDLEDWYRRPDNFGQGDMHRLITCCTPHRGSHLVKALMRYAATCERIADPTQATRAKSLLRLIELAYGISSGAFGDQEPNSAALRALGATRTPAHAIACVAEPVVDYRAFNELYRWLFVTLYMTAPPDALRGLFSREDDAQARRAEALVAFHESHGGLGEGVVQRFITALSGAMISHDGDTQRSKDYDQALTQFCAALFEGTRNDGAVGERSAKGGLSKPAYITTIPHTLHSFACRYPAVQDRIVGLLEGSFEPFDPQGFPAPAEVQEPAGAK